MVPMGHFPKYTAILVAGSVWATTIPCETRLHAGEPQTAVAAPKEAPSRKADAKVAKADRSKDAITDSTKADASFALQGEYWSSAASLDPLANWGLQVVALGNDRFDAVLLSGGLPGAGWNRRAKTRMSGASENGSVILKGERFRARVASDEATLEDESGTTVGRLRKIHRISATQDEPPPPGALSLFDGTTTDAFQGGTMNSEGLLQVGAVTRTPVSQFRMHIEFRTPYMPLARGQGRGNSGVYIQERYEVQILDSFGLEGEANECGGLYKQRPPEVNMCLPPLSWQTYDIYFTSARWDQQGAKIANARLTLLHNGVPVHNDYELTGKTGSGKTETPEPRPILLQNHGNPVHFRNIWFQPCDAARVEPVVLTDCGSQLSRCVPITPCSPVLSTWITCP